MHTAAGKVAVVWLGNPIRGGKQEIDSPSRIHEATNDQEERTKKRRSRRRKIPSHGIDPESKEPEMEMKRIARRKGQNRRG